MAVGESNNLYIPNHKIQVTDGNFQTMSYSPPCSFKYVGCFVDYTSTIRALPYQIYGDQSGYEACFQQAQFLGYRYVGFQWWNGPALGLGYCFGGNDLTSAESQGIATNCAQVQTTDGSVIWGGAIGSGASNAVSDLWDATFDFENIVITTNFVNFGPVGSVLGGWTAGGNLLNQDARVAIVSSQNGIGYASPFPNNLQYTCVLQTVSSGQLISSITRRLTGMVAGSSYFVSFWATCRGGYECPPSQSFTVLLDGVTVYSTSPTSTSWVLVSSTTSTALNTSMNLVFQLSNLGNGNDIDMAIDAIALQHANPWQPKVTQFYCTCD